MMTPKSLTSFAGVAHLETAENACDRRVQPRFQCYGTCVRHRPAGAVST
jgi:hypothetical protein